MKICTKCQKSHELTHFYKDSGMPSGIRKICKDCDKAKFAKWRSKNREIHNEAAREWNEQNKEICLKRAKEWNKNNPDKRRFITKLRKKYIKERTPKWANLNSIKEFYKNCPEGYHVDHIIPLRGKIISGLHIRENLQYLKQEDNIRKGNKYA